MVFVQDLKDEALVHSLRGWWESLCYSWNNFRQLAHCTTVFKSQFPNAWRSSSLSLSSVCVVILLPHAFWCLLRGFSWRTRIFWVLFRVLELTSNFAEFFFSCRILGVLCVASSSWWICCTKGVGRRKTGGEGLTACKQMVALSAAEVRFIQGGIAHDLRSDGRGRYHFRPFSIQSGVIPQVC